MPRVAPAVSINSVTEATLRHLVRAPSTPQGLALRGRIVLAAAAGQSNQQIASALDLPQVTVGKWRRSFAQRGLEGLQDAPRSGCPIIHGREVWHRVQSRACQQPEFQSRWSVRTLAREVGLPRSTVHEMLAEIIHPELFSGSIPPGAAVKLNWSQETPIHTQQISKRFSPLS